jgi:hypothetical protein
MKLNIMDRLMLLSILPAEGNLITLKLVRDIKNELSFSEKEIKKIGFKQDETGINWENNINIEKDIKIGDTMKDVIKKQFEELDKENKLNMEHLEIAERFIG